MGIMARLKVRLGEPSTYAGLGLAIMGFGQVFKIEEAPAIAQTVEAVGQAVGGGDLVGGLVLGLTGLAAAFLGEKGKR